MTPRLTWRKSSMSPLPPSGAGNRSAPSLPMAPWLPSAKCTKSPRITCWDSPTLTPIMFSATAFPIFPRLNWISSRIMKPIFAGNRSTPAKKANFESTQKIPREKPEYPISHGIYTLDFLMRRSRQQQRYPSMQPSKDFFRVMLRTNKHSQSIRL